MKLQRSRMYVLATLLAWMVPIEAQKAQPIRERVAVTVIEVPVTVTDRSGNPLTELSVENFQLYDDGKGVPIAYFETVDLENVAASANARINPVARLNIVILFDLSYSKPGTLERARRAATEFVETQMTERDRAVVATYSVETGFNVATSFTSDRDLLKLAIQTLGHPKFFRPTDPLLLSAIPASSGADPTTAGFDRGAEAMAIAEVFDGINQAIEDRFSGVRLERQFESFANFARLLESVSGRKQIIMLSEGFDPRLVQGKEASTAENIADMDAIATGEPWRVSSDDRYGLVSTKRELMRMGEIFRRSDVVLHAVDIKGIRTRVDARGGFSRDSNEALFLMTEPTGGRVFKNSNDLAENLSRLIRQQRFVYILGFHGTAGGEPGRFHNLDVRLQHVPGGRVTHRAGYYEQSEDLSGLERTLTSADILLNDIPQEAITISTLAIPLKIDDGMATVPVIAEIDGISLTRGLAEDATLLADLFVYAFDRDNSLHDFRHQKLEIDLAKVGETLAGSGLKFYGTLRLPPGEYGIKTLLTVEQTGLRGFDRQDVRVADTGEAALLPPLVFEEEGKWIMVKAQPREVSEVAYPFHFASESFIPSALPKLQSAGANRFAMFAYDLDFEQDHLRAGIRSATGETHDAKIEVIGKVAADGEEPAKLVLSIDTSGLDEGSYSLDFSVEPREREARYVTSQPFEILAGDPPGE